MEKDSFLKILDIKVDNDDFIVESKKTFFTPSFRKIIFVSAKEDLESLPMAQQPENSFMVFKRKVKDNFEEQAKTNRGLYIMKRWCNKDVEDTLKNILEEKKVNIHKIWLNMVFKSGCLKRLIFQNKINKAINCFKNFKLNKYLSEIEIQKIELLKKEKELNLLFDQYRKENELLKEKLASSTQSSEVKEKDFLFLKQYSSKENNSDRWFGLTKNESLMMMMKLICLREKLAIKNQKWILKNKSKYK